MPGYVTDEFGLTLPNQYMELFFPVYNRSIVLLVKYRHNPIYNRLNYGPLPTVTSDTFSLYSGLAGASGGAASPSAAGQVPASGWIKNKQYNVPSTFNVVGTFPYGNGDIFYTQVPTRVLEVKQYLTPAWLRISIDIPTGQVQEQLQDQVSGGVDQDFGWTRGRSYAVHIPNIHYGYGFGNDSNLPVYTRAVFRYAEQEVELIKDPAVAFAIMTGAIPAHRVTMPVVSTNATLEGVLKQTYGFTGLPVYPPDKRTVALQVYADLLAKNQNAQQGLI